MKVSLMQPALVLALALGLASCGGKAGFDIAGSVSGLQYDGLELSSNGMTVTVKAPAAGTTTPVPFSFGNQIEYGEVYDVKVTKKPAHQTCKVVNGVNTAGRLETINVTVECSLVANTISGKVIGLTSKGLVLTNGSTGGTVTPTPEAPTFVFPQIPYGQPYGITVLTQPSEPKAQTCAVTANGVGTMGDEPIAGVNQVVVEC